MTSTILAQEVRYSTRNTRGRYLQRLLLDTARCLAPTLPNAWRAYERASLLVEEGHARVVITDKEAGQFTPALTAAQVRVLNLVGHSLARQVKRLTGATSFELSTWQNTLPTQPVELCLTTASGQDLRLFNPSSSANRYFHAIVSLCEVLEAHFGTEARRPEDLDTLVQTGLLEGWTAQPCTAKSARSIGLALDWSAASISRARAGLSASEMPESLVLIEEYEAALEAGTVRQTSRWGQHGAEAAAERTKTRQARLNPSLAADLTPLSRSLKETSIEELKKLANERPLSHLAIEFGVSDKALAKRLDKAGWVSPRAKGKARRGR